MRSKKSMSKLIAVANRLDQMGLNALADSVDEAIRALAIGMDSDKFKRELDEMRERYAESKDPEIAAEYDHLTDKFLESAAMIYGGEFRGDDCYEFRKSEYAAGFVKFVRRNVKDTDGTPVEPFKYCVYI